MWQTADYCRESDPFSFETEWDEVAPFLQDRVFRTNFDSPGFALLKLGPMGSVLLRDSMLRLKSMLSKLMTGRKRERLEFLSFGRFDQQVTTRFHLDGAPEASILMLGYEPTTVQSRVWLADYSRAAFDRDLTPSAYLDRFNPMFQVNEDDLAPYVTEVEAFDSRQSQILLVNNSRLPFSSGGDSWLGVLHKAEIVVPDPSATRVINSAMMIEWHESQEIVSPQGQEEFLTSDRLSQRY